MAIDNADKIKKVEVSSRLRDKLQKTDLKNWDNLLKDCWWAPMGQDGILVSTTDKRLNDKRMYFKITDSEKADLILKGLNKEHKR